jgi:hypothetical protein
MMSRRVSQAFKERDVSAMSDPARPWCRSEQPDLPDPWIYREKRSRAELPRLSVRDGNRICLLLAVADAPTVLGEHASVRQIVMLLNRRMSSDMPIRREIASLVDDKYIELVDRHGSPLRYRTTALGDDETARHQRRAFESHLDTSSWPRCPTTRPYDQARVPKCHCPGAPHDGPFYGSR